MIARTGRRRPGARTPAGVLLAVAGLAAALSACTGDAAQPPPVSTTTTPPGTTPATSPTTSPTSATTVVPAFDCPSVDAAQQELDDAFGSELDRLGVRRGDPRAQSLYALVTTTQGPAYYSAVLAAAPPELVGDARTVLDYYQRLAARAGDLDAGDGSTEDLTAAMSALDDAAAAVDDPAAGTEVVDAQERLRAALERVCSGPDASSSPSGTATTTGTATGTAASSPAG